MNERDRSILLKIVEESDVLSKMLSGKDEQSFLENDQLMRATCMTMINISELTKKLTMEFRQESEQVPWKDMAGLRDVTAHGYFTLQMSDIWIFASTELPEYTAKIRDILK
ncbi:MAG: DUF86 domain-containing protein [Fusobacteriaceae bacterium]|jgi:uncharacterized protein with HEPN domain|nr:DUF86 domain-containing protein [Fusobacteriaceae bacterium]